MEVKVPHSWTVRSVSGSGFAFARKREKEIAKKRATVRTGREERLSFMVEPPGG
jgi:hypothetical protein